MRLYVYLMVTEAFVRNSNANSTPIGSTLSTSALVDSLTAGMDDVPILRYLRTTVTADEDEDNRKQIASAHKDNEERAGPLKLTSNADSAESTTPLLEGQNSEFVLQDLAFIKNDRMNAKDEVIMHKNLNKWIRETKETRQHKFINAVLSTLLKYYDNDELYKVLEAAKVKPVEADANAPHNGISSVEVAKLLQDEVLKKWSIDNIRPHQVFKYMGLSSDQKNILASPTFSVWINYIKQFSSHDPTKTNEITELLKFYYQKDVFQMIQAAQTKSGDVKKLATELQEQLMTYWLEKRHSPAHVIKVVTHGRKLDDVLTSPYLSVWTNYLKQYNLRHSPETNEIKALTSAYDEKDVFQMLQATKTRDGSVGQLATELQEQNKKMWIDEKYNPYRLIDIIGPLGMEQNHLATLWSEYLPFFSKYVDALGEFKGEHKINAVDMLVEYYKDELVFPMLRSMKISSELKTKCEEQLMQRWIDDQADPKDIFNRMKDGRNIDEVSTNPISSFWIQYLKKYNEANQGVKINETKLLEKYGKNVVLQSLEELKKIDGMKNPASKLGDQYQAKYTAQNVHSSN